MTDQRKGNYKVILVIGCLVLVGAIGVISSKAKPKTTALEATTASQLLTTTSSILPTTRPEISPTLETVIVSPTSTSVRGSQGSATLTATPTSMQATSTSSPAIQATSLPSTLVPTNSPSALCNQAGNLVDVTIPAGSQVIAGQPFVKIWSVQNTGSCTWRADYRLVLSAGTLIYPIQSIQLGESVPPETVWPISIDVVAPNSIGAYYDTWKLYTNTGQVILDENGLELEFPISVSVIPATAQIIGRITIDGGPINTGVILSLEDAYSHTIASLTTSADGTFSYTGIPVSSDGYYVIFSEAANPQFGMDQVVSWAWVGPIAAQGGDVIQLPDIDISRLGFGQVSPAPEAVYSSTSLSFNNPILFTWAAYPDAFDYWVDLVRGEEEKVWQSQLVSALSTPFDGTLSDGSHIQPDEYWWAVGARRWAGSYPQAVYTYLTSISFDE